MASKQQYHRIDGTSGQLRQEFEMCNHSTRKLVKRNEDLERLVGSLQQQLKKAKKEEIRLNDVIDGLCEDLDALSPQKKQHHSNTDDYDDHHDDLPLRRESRKPKHSREKHPGLMPKLSFGHLRPRLWH
jgi:predicted nuclease with TOPRIM domain